MRKLIPMREFDPNETEELHQTEPEIETNQNIEDREPLFLRREYNPSIYLFRLTAEEIEQHTSRKQQTRISARITKGCRPKYYVA
jgi:hypothetical protein